MNLVIARNMVAAETLKIRRNRTVLAVSLLLSVGIVLVLMGYNAIQHASNAAQYSPAGGTLGFGHAVRLLGVFFGTLVAALVGSEAGTADIESGVFRDLVATGRSRLSLFWVRLPGAVLITFAVNLIGLALAAVLSFVFAGGLPTPSASLILESAAWILMCNTVACAFALGVGSITGSRGATLTTVIGFEAVATPLLLHINSLGSARDALQLPAFSQLMPVSGDLAGVTMTAGVAVAVLLAWTVIPTVLGSWRTVARDA